MNPQDNQSGQQPGAAITDSTPGTAAVEQPAMPLPPASSLQSSQPSMTSDLQSGNSQVPQTVAQQAEAASDASLLPPTVPVYPMNSEDEGTSSQPAEQPSFETAADGDVIEKEWVEKAKKLVATTRTDPYQQVREINQLKAEYLKKRYNKDIKTTGN